MALSVTVVLHWIDCGDVQGFLPDISGCLLKRQPKKANFPWGCDARIQFRCRRSLALMEEMMAAWLSADIGTVRKDPPKLILDRPKLQFF